MIIQILINGLISAGVYLLMGLGFSLIYSVSRFFHFTHGIMFTAGAYTAWVLSALCGLPIWLSVIVAVAVCSIFGAILDIYAYRPLRRKGSSSLILLLASLGLYILLQNGISIVFGDEAKILHKGGVEVFDIGPGRITLTQVSIIAGSVALSALLSIFSRSTMAGKSFRAVASDPVLARVCGIEPDYVMLTAFAAGSALAALAGILAALDVAMAPTMGLNPLMMCIVASTIGGIGKISGVAYGAVLLGMAQHFGAWGLGSKWQDAIAFAILLGFMLVRPQGFLGVKLTKAKV